MVLAVIVFCLKVHLTAEVTALIKMGIPDIGLAIVYRTIQLLNELHLIDRVNFDDGFVGCGIGNTTEQKQRIHHPYGDRFSASIRTLFVKIIDTRLSRHSGFTFFRSASIPADHPYHFPRQAEQA